MQMERAATPDDWRERVLQDPELILEDRDLMRALIAANDRLLGGNVVDMRGIAMERLESRLERLEETHRSVIAAAYENLAGTNQINRAVLKLLDETDFETFLKTLGTDIAATLRVDRVRLVLESTQATETSAPRVQKLEDVLTIVAPGFIDAYVTQGRNVPQRQVTLRAVGDDAEKIFGDDDEWIRSEALMRLDLGPRRLPGLLVMGAEDPHQFRPSQGTDLLTFFTGVFERLMRRWLG
ncbi:DUF484 family protein [Rhodobacterales bacterium HKCCE3408]|nr:DUF484 family protein [Rhodobacterales bacterium HKCCE3408]